MTGLRDEFASLAPGRAPAAPAKPFADAPAPSAQARPAAAAPPARRAFGAQDETVVLDSDDDDAAPAPKRARARPAAAAAPAAGAAFGAHDAPKRSIVVLVDERERQANANPLSIYLNLHEELRRCSAALVNAENSSASG